MEYIGNKKKQGSIVELLRDEILAGNIPDGSEMTQNELGRKSGSIPDAGKRSYDLVGVSGIDRSSA